MLGCRFGCERRTGAGEAERYLSRCLVCVCVCVCMRVCVCVCPSLDKMRRPYSGSVVGGMRAVCEEVFVVVIGGFRSVICRGFGLLRGHVEEVSVLDLGVVRVLV